MACACTGAAHLAARHCEALTCEALPRLFAGAAAAAAAWRTARHAAVALLAIGLLIYYGALSICFIGAPMCAFG